MKNDIGLLDAVLKSSIDGFCMTDPQGKILDVNDTLCAMVEYDREQLLQMSISDVEATESSQQLQRYLDRMVDADEERFETQYQRSDGSHLDVEISTCRVDVNDVEDTRLIVFVRNITQQKNNETALQESERTYRSLVETVQDLIFQTDREGRYSVLNKSWEPLFGYTVDEMLGKKFTDFMSPDIAKKDMEEFARLLEGGMVKGYETIHLDKQGNPIYLSFNAKYVRDLNGNIIGTNGTAHDITGRKKAETELHKKEREYKTLFDKMLNGFAVHEIICDDNGVPVDYRFLAINPAFQQMTGMDSAIIGTTVKELLPNIEQSWIDNYGKVALTGEPYSFENYNAALGKHFEVTAFRPAPMQFACIFADITERKGLEARLRQAEKMEAIGHLAGGIAHDFNNILGGIIGYTDMSLDEVYEGSLLHNNLTQILHASDRARHLVSQILSFSKQSAPQMETVQIAPIVEEVTHLLRATLPTTIEINTTVHQPQPFVLADETKIHEIVMNLCTNAAHAMQDEKGVLEVTCQQTELTAPQKSFHGKIQPGKYIQITVSDNGCGMDRDTINHIFEPFFTTKEVGKGTGMGLAVVFGIVESHNGNVVVQSELHKGTTFHIYLPLVKDPQDVADDRQEGEKPRRQTSTKDQIHILFVDDEPFLCKMGDALLSSLGYSVVTCSSSSEALSTFKETPDKFDLLITDQTMPGLTGVELAGEVHAIRKGFPVILCTGYSNQVDESMAQSKDILGFLMKPFRKGEMETVIHSVLHSNS